MKTCCIICVLFSTTCHLFHNFIFFCSNNTHVFHKLCTKILNTPHPTPPSSLWKVKTGQQRFCRNFWRFWRWTVSVLNHELSWPAKDHYPFPEVELHHSTQNSFRPCVTFREETLPEESVKIMIQCYEHVLYKNDIRICELQQWRYQIKTFRGIRDKK